MPLRGPSAKDGAVPMLLSTAAYDLSPMGLTALLAAGLAAGFVNTMAGGGSNLALPALMLLGLPADVANGTNRVSIVAQSVSGAFFFHRAGKLDTAAVGPVLAPTLLGSFVGSMVAAHVPETWLKPILLVTMLSVALLMVLKPKRMVGEPDETPKRFNERPMGLVALFGAGLYGGFVQAGVGFLLLGVLGGMLRYDLVRANALKLICTLVFGVVSLSVFVWAGQVSWVPGIVLAAASIVGSQVGVRFAVRVNPAVIRWIVFAAVLVASVAALLK